jgi:hypothetical protein
MVVIDCMVVGNTSTYTICAYHHRCVLNTTLWHNVFSDLRQVDSLLYQPN